MATLGVIVGDDNNIDILISKNILFFIHACQFVKPKAHTDSFLLFITQ